MSRVMRLDPRTAVLAQYDLSSSDRLAVKQVKGLLVEDQYAPSPSPLPLPWLR